MKMKALKCSELPVWKWVLWLLAGLIFFIYVYARCQDAETPGHTLPAKLALMTGAALIILALYSGVRLLLERKWPSDIFNRKIPADLLLGLGIGTGMISLSTLILAALGCYRIESFGCEPQALLFSLAYCFIVACGEEVLFRGILFRMTDERFNTPAALAVSSLMFGFMHIFNQGATVWSSTAIAVEAGLMLAATYKYSGSLWLPIGIHWAWNFVEGDIFGFAVSGCGNGSSLVQASISGPEIITGGSFGVEASIVACLLGLGIALRFIFLTRKSGRV